jgi:hypothetical protein
VGLGKNKMLQCLLSSSEVDQLDRCEPDIGLNIESLKSVCRQTPDVRVIAQRITSESQESILDAGTLESGTKIMARCIAAVWKKRTFGMICAITSDVCKYQSHGIGYTWPKHTPVEAMCLYLRTVGAIVPQTDICTICRYVATIDQVIGPHEPCQYLNACLLFDDLSSLDQARAVIDISLSFVEYMSPSSFPSDTYLSRMTPAEYCTYIVTLRNCVRKSALAAQCMRGTQADREKHPVTEQVHSLSWIYDPKTTDEATLNPQQRLLEFLFAECGRQSLQHDAQFIFRPVYTSDNRCTRFYKQEKEVVEFVYGSVVPRSAYPEMYDAITRKSGTASGVAELLVSLPDPRFPVCTSNRCMFSFANGIYDCVAGMFYTYDFVPASDILTVSELDMQGRTCTANFLEAHLPITFVKGEVESILTPTFDKILLDQKFSAKDMFWFQVMLGRTLHDVGSKDDWQVSLYLKGKAGSGKSTIFRLWAEVYPVNMVGFLADDSETTFSDQHLVDVNLVCALDVSSEFRMATTRFNSYCSGEQVVINRKFKTAKSVKWRAPIVFASNGVPPIKTRGGSGTRRMVIFLFDHFVREVDTMLMQKCRLELPFFMVKCARRYLDAVEQFGNRGLWEDDILPEMCHRGRREYMCATSPISAFFSSDLIEKDDQSVVLLQTLRNTYGATLAHGATGVDSGMQASQLMQELDMLGCILHEKGAYNASKYPGIEKFNVAQLDLSLLPERREDARVYGLRIC